MVYFFCLDLSPTFSQIALPTWTRMYYSYRLPLSIFRMPLNLTRRTRDSNFPCVHDVLASVPGFLSRTKQQRDSWEKTQWEIAALIIANSPEKLKAYYYLLYLSRLY